MIKNVSEGKPAIRRQHTTVRVLNRVDRTDLVFDDGLKKQTNAHN